MPDRLTAIEPLAVDAAGAGRLVGVSRATWWRWHSAGRVPMPVRIGAKTPRWRTAELREWLDAGCPDRETWKRQRTA